MELGGRIMKEWLQRLQEELQKYDDDDLCYWPVMWWKGLQRDSMNPLQAIQYNQRIRRMAFGGLS